MRWGSSGGGGPGSAGLCGPRQGRGQGGRGQRPGHRREGRVATGRGQGRATGAKGALEEGTGRSLGSRGPWTRGSSPHYAAAVRSRCLLRRPSFGPRRAGPASPQPSPDGPGPAPPAGSLPGPPATPCASAGLQKVRPPYPTAALISGPGQLCPLRGRERDRNRAGGQDRLRDRDKGAETRVEVGQG